MSSITGGKLPSAIAPASNARIKQRADPGGQRDEQQACCLAEQRDRIRRDHSIND
jgi:hypothetical protein